MRHARHLCDQTTGDARRVIGRWSAVRRLARPNPSLSLSLTHNTHTHARARACILLGARRRGVSPLAPRRELDLDDAGATVNNSLGTHAATRTISEPDANGETRVTASTVGALERMVRLAEAGAYLGAAVQVSNDVFA